MTDSEVKRRIEGRGLNAELLGEELLIDEDLAMEQILENISNTPIGQLLKNIASLPEVRRIKVLDLRRQLTDGRYSVSERLDVAMDRVLEDIAT